MFRTLKNIKYYLKLSFNITKLPKVDKNSDIETVFSKVFKIKILNDISSYYFYVL